MPKMVNFASFWKLQLAVKQCYQTGQLLIRQKLVENVTLKKFKYDILSNFQTICSR